MRSTTAASINRPAARESRPARRRLQVLRSARDGVEGAPPGSPMKGDSRGGEATTGKPTAVAARKVSMSTSRSAVGSLHSRRMTSRSPSCTACTSPLEMLPPLTGGALSRELSASGFDGSSSLTRVDPGHAGDRRGDDAPQPASSRARAAMESASMPAAARSSPDGPEVGTSRTAMCSTRASVSARAESTASPRPPAA